MMDFFSNKKDEDKLPSRLPDEDKQSLLSNKPSKADIKEGELPKQQMTRDEAKKQNLQVKDKSQEDEDVTFQFY